MTRSIPTHSLGKFEDIDHAVCFPASKEAGFVTSQTIIVDRGSFCPNYLKCYSKLRSGFLLPFKGHLSPAGLWIQRPLEGAE